MSKLSQIRLTQLTNGMVVQWQTGAHRVCGRELVDDYRIRLCLCPQDEHLSSFHEEDRFWTLPISAALTVPVLERNSKLKRRRQAHHPESQEQRGAA